MHLKPYLCTMTYQGGLRPETYFPSGKQIVEYIVPAESLADQAVKIDGTSLMTSG